MSGSIDPTNVVVGVLFVLQALGLIQNVAIKKDTQQVNKSVNHIDEGEPTLIQQVRLAREENAIWHGQFLQYKLENEDRFDAIEEKFEGIDDKQEQIRGKIAEASDQVVITNKKIEELFKVVPKRKDDL